MKKCSFCAEEIQDEAIVCRYCGRDLSVPPLPFVIIEEPKKSREAKKVVEESKTQPQIVKKKDFSIAVLFTIIIGLVACVIFAMTQSNWTSSPPLDSASIQNTAAAMAWTSVVQTQIASTPPTPRPTAIPFIMPKGDFQMSWNSYSSEYNSLGGIITITKKGSNYMEKIVMSDGSSGTFELSVLSEGSTIKLDGHFGDSYKLYPHDYIQIESNGWLGFYDEQGLIYKVPPR